MDGVQRRRSAKAEVINCFSVHDSEGPAADHSENPAHMTDPEEPHSRSGTDSAVTMPATNASADDEVAEAEARAEAARARLVQLRRAAESGDDSDEDAASADVQPRPTKWIRPRLRLPRRPARPRWLHRPGRKTLAVGAGTVLASASLAASGYMLWQHHTARHDRQLAAELTVAARQGVTALMSIDPDHAKEDVQRMIDASTGDQKSQLSVMSLLIVNKAVESKVGSKATVEAVAVESLGDDSGVVLVAVKTAPFGPDNAKPPPALFRLSVSMNRDDGQLKMSKVDFLQ
jgi:Mce-associated membrane protein